MSDIQMNLAIANNGYPYWFDSFIIHVYELLGITSNELMPDIFNLHQSYPNRFNPTTTVQYELHQRSDVQITIYDLLGRKVTTLVAETQEAGYKTVICDATNDLGQPVSAGVYLYQIKVYDPDAIGAGNYTQTRKMVVLK